MIRIKTILTHTGIHPFQKLLPWVGGLLVIFGFSHTLKSQSLYFPPSTGNQWETTDPKSLGWCQPNIDSLYQYLEDKNSKAFILLKDGKIVLEKYFGTFNQDSSWYWASAGKTLTAFCIGIAQQQGSLKLSDPSNKYLGNSWSSLTQSQEDSITLWHHLTMTTGLDDEVSNLDCTDPSCLKFKAKPGTRWSYHNAPYTLLDKVIENSTSKSLNLFITQNITAKSGIKGLFIDLDYNNVFFSTPRNMAKFGLLLLGKGTWNTTKILSDSQYFKQQINTSQSINKSYGYLTWLNGKTSHMLPTLQYQFPGSICTNAPADMYAALGKNGQIINVVPSQNLVLIRMGNAPDNNPASAISVALNDDIWKYINRFSCNAGTHTQPQYRINVWPNPANSKEDIHLDFSFDVTTIAGGNEVIISITDPAGKKISTHSLIINEANTSYQLPQLAPGVYTLQCSLNQQVFLQNRLCVLPK